MLKEQGGSAPWLWCAILCLFFLLLQWLRSVAVWGHLGVLCHSHSHSHSSTPRMYGNSWQLWSPRLGPVTSTFLIWTPCAIHLHQPSLTCTLWLVFWSLSTWSLYAVGLMLHAAPWPRSLWHTCCLEVRLLLPKDWGQAVAPASQGPAAAPSPGRAAQRPQGLSPLGAPFQVYPSSISLPQP